MEGESECEKDQVMVVLKHGNDKARVKYGDEKLECITEFLYLGVTFSSDDRWEKEVGKRVQFGRSALSMISKQVIWNKNVSVNVKKVIFEVMVKSKLMYGGEVWWADRQQMDKLETLEWFC